MTKLDLTQTDVVAHAADIIVKILEGRQPLRFHELLRHFDYAKTDAEKHVVICNILTEALYNLKQEGKIKRKLGREGVYYSLLLPREQAIERGIIIVIAIAVALFIIKLMQ